MVQVTAHRVVVHVPRPARRDQALTVREKEPEVRKFYDTCGVYLGYGLAQNIEC